MFNWKEIAVAWFLEKLCCYIAYMERGHLAVGGELAVFPLILFACFYLGDHKKRNNRHINRRAGRYQPRNTFSKSEE